MSTLKIFVKLILSVFYTIALDLVIFDVKTVMNYESFII